ncbi:hypothetical protein COY32_02225 [candidate division WWE3 bacterium CG_4_10_14_0_2_um_filter_41_14]|uniref:Carbohydrate kinase PfkB domain-containing protein n=1 Tax=candidate division WWE3 bacterium CG_4_10_14_0_2_um_filter_41_14 TaxID=1975072 RepID=A0A2M7TKX5_UNCKA|nr:MAG: hypothetical protein COY32_02225 [candidate division WWE3 bacterium CG_4_10_14_0_2_um_filter_41_14]
MATIACIGHTTLDIILFLSQGHVQDIPGALDELCIPFPSKIAVDTRAISLGGNAPNVGAGLRVTGNKVILISQIGDDEVGEVIRNLISKWNFDLSYTGIEGESNVSVILSHSKDRTILSYHNGSMYHFPSSLVSVDYLYLSSLGFTNCDPIHAAVCAYTKTNPDTKLIYNPGKHEIKNGVEREKELLSHCHTLIVNREEAEDMIGFPHSECGDDEAAKKLMNAYISKGISRIVVTDSESGVYGSDGKGRMFHMPIYPCDVVEKTGAGDAFSSGYITGLIETQSFEQALTYGVAQSTSVVSIPGATNGLINKDMLRARIKEFSSITLRVL